MVEPITAAIAAGTYLYKGITTTFGGQDNLQKHSGKSYSHIVCSKPECTKKHTSCCNKCDSSNVNNCGKFGIFGLGIGGFPGLGKNCSTCGCPAEAHRYAYANESFPMF